MSSLQECPELVPAARDARPYGADPDSQHFRDFLVREALDVAQHHRLAKHRRQPGEPLPHSTPLIGGHRQLLRPARRIRVGHLPLARVVPQRLRQRPPARQPVPAVVHRDAKDPGLERGPAPEAPEMPVDPEEDLLRKVRCLFVVSGEAKSQIVDHLLEPGIDLVESPDVSGAVSLDQLDVDSEIVDDSGNRGYPHRILPGRPKTTLCIIRRGDAPRSSRKDYLAVLATWAPEASAPWP